MNVFNAKFIGYFFMHQTDLFLVFTRPLDSVDALYMVTGSVAGIAYGEPRLTNDIDIVLAIDDTLADQLAAIFPSDRFYCPPRDVIGIESRRSHRGHFNLIHHESGLKADMFLAGADPLLAWGLTHRQNVTLDEHTSIWIAPLAYVILKKLEYYREGGSEKHAVDIRGMLAVSEDQLDVPFLEEQLDVMHLRPAWKQITRK